MNLELSDFGAVVLFWADAGPLYELKNGIHLSDWIENTYLYDKFFNISSWKTDICYLDTYSD